jgi:hypothetical protein
MRLLYAVQFEIASSANAPTTTLGADVVQTVSSWILEWYSTRKAIQITFPLNGGAVSPINGHDINVTRGVSDRAKVGDTIVSWSYPDDNDGNLFWHSRIEIGEFGGLVEFSLQLFLDSTQYLIAPVEFNLRRPRLVGMLLRQFNCFCGDTRLSLEPREIGAESIEDFTTTRLLSPNRRLPIVLVSRTASSGKCLVDPTELADPLAGIAETYYLADKWAGFALTDVVGKLYSCFNGAVRLYWPDFAPAESPFSPVYVPEKLNQIGARLTDILFRQLATISAFRYVTGPVTRDAREHLQEERNRETAELKAAAAERGDLNELLDLAVKENDELRSRNDQLREQSEGLRAGLQLAQENFRAIRQSQAEAEAASVETASDEPGADPQSVEEAVLAAKQEYEDTMVVQDSALDSAKESPFMQYKKVSQALLAMHEVCLSWRQSRKTKTPMGTFEQAFATKGFVYKSRESATSRGKWSEEYEMTYKGQRVSIESHLALGKGGPDTCLRIYFYADTQDEKFIVAHVGRHKTNTRT